MCRSQEDDRREHEVGEECGRPEGGVRLSVQEEEQRGAAEEEDDDEGGERPQRMHVVDSREAAGPPERVPGADLLVEHRRHRQPRERKPREGGQDEEPDEDADGQEDEGPDHERDQERTQRGPPAEDEQARADVAEREERRRQDEERPLRIPAAADRDLVEDGDHEPEREAREEVAPVEPDGVRDELADGAVGGRDLVWSGGHALRRYPPASASTSCSCSHVRYP